MAFTFKVRRIGNSVGVILPKKLGLHQNEKLNGKLNKDGRLSINLQDALAKKRGKMINESFANLNDSLTLNQLENHLRHEGINLK